MKKLITKFTGGNFEMNNFVLNECVTKRRYFNKILIAMLIICFAFALITFSDEVSAATCKGCNIFSACSLCGYCWNCNPHCSCLGCTQVNTCGGCSACGDLYCAECQVCENHSYACTCNDCDHPAVGRSYSSNGSGGHKITCIYCDEVISYSTAHTYTTTTTAATCTKAGSTKTACMYCSYTSSTTTLAALGHSWYDYDATSHKCSTCSTTQNHSDSNSDGKCDTCGYVMLNLVITRDKESWTNTDVVVTISSTNTGYTLKYSYDATNWYEYASNLVISENKTVYAALFSGSTIALQKNVVIDYIDKNVPAVAPSATVAGDNSNVTISANATDNLSGINTGLTKYYLSSNSTLINESSDKWVSSNVFSNIVPLNTYYYQVMVTDNAGNVTVSGQGTVYINDILLPTVSLDKTTVFEGDLLKITLQDDASGVVAWGISSDAKVAPTSWNVISVTTSTIVNYIADTSGTLYIWAKDASGNVSSEGVALTVLKRVAMLTLDGVGTSYTSLKDASVAVPTNKTYSLITMFADDTLTSTLTIAATQNVELDLNGNTVSVVTSSSVALSGITNNGTFTLSDSSEDMTGNFYVDYNGTASTDYKTYGISNATTASILNVIDARITVESTTRSSGIYNLGTITTDAATISSTNTSTTAFAIESSSALAVVLENTNLIANGDAGNAYGYYETKANSNAILENVNITAYTSLSTGVVYGIYKTNTGTVTYDGGTIDVDAMARYGYGVYNNAAGTINILSGNIDVYNTNTGTTYYTYGVYNVAGGTINIGSDDGEMNPEALHIKAKDYGVYMKTAAGILNFYDGIIEGSSAKSIYNAVPGSGNDSIAYGYSLRTLTLDNGNEKAYLGSPYVTLEVEGQDIAYYRYLKDAVAAVPTDGTYSKITMFDDETITSAITIVAGMNIELDLKGNIVTINTPQLSTSPTAGIVNNGILKLTDSSEGMVGSLDVKYTGESTYTNSSGSSATYFVYGIYNIVATAELSIENAKVTLEATTRSSTIHTLGKFTADGAVMSVSSTASSAVCVENAGNKKVVIRDSEIYSTSSAGTSYGFYDTKANGDATIENTNITATTTYTSGTVYGIYKANTGTVTYDGGTIDVDAMARYGYGVYNKAAGTINILSGNIDVYNTNTGTTYYTYGIYNEAGGTINIGSDDGNVSSDSPYVNAKDYGVYMKTAAGVLNFYDGNIEGSTSKSIYNAIPGSSDDGIVDGYSLRVNMLGNDREQSVLGSPYIKLEVQGQETTYYRYLKDAIADVPVDGTFSKITMLEDETISSGFIVSSGKNILLDLNGKEVKFTPGEISNSIYGISNVGILEITDSSSNKAGCLSLVYEGKSDYDDSTIVFTRLVQSTSATSDLKLTSVRLQIDSTTATSAIYLVDGVALIDNVDLVVNAVKSSVIGVDSELTSTLNINNSTITVNKTGTSSNVCGVACAAVNTINLLNTDISVSTTVAVAAYGINNEVAGTINYNGGEINVEATTRYAYGIYNSNKAGVINVLNGSINSTNTNTGTTYYSYGVYNNAGGTINIGSDDGNVSSDSPYVNAKDYGVYMKTAAGVLNFYDGIIEGSTSKSIYNAIPGSSDDGIVDGYSLRVNMLGNDREQSVLGSPYVKLEIQGQDVAYYRYLKDAIADVPADGTFSKITMLDDETMNIGLTIASGKNVELDLNGHIVSIITSTDGPLKGITNVGSLSLIDNSDEKTGKLFVDYNGTADATNNRTHGIDNSSTAVLIVKDVTVEVESTTWTAGIIGYGSVNVDGANIVVSNAASYASGIRVLTTTLLQIDNSEITVVANSGEAYSVYDNKASSNVVINNTKLNCTTLAASKAYGIYKTNTGSITYNGGTIDVDSTSRYAYGIYNNSTATINVLAGNFDVNNTNTGTTYYTYGIYNVSTGAVNIGTKDGNVIPFSPYINAKDYGVYLANASAVLSFYDGTTEGATDKALYGTIDNIEDNSTVFTTAISSTREQVKVGVIKDINSLTVEGIEKSYVYTGEAIKPVPVVKDGGDTLISDTDYTVSYGENINVGTGTVIITGKGLYEGTIVKEFTITQDLPSLSVTPTSLKVVVGESATAKISYNGDGELIVDSENEDVATVSVDDYTKIITVTGLQAGKTKITIAALAGTNYLAANAVELSVDVGINDGNYLVDDIQFYTLKDAYTYIDNYMSGVGEIKAIKSYIDSSAFVVGEDRNIIVNTNGFVITKIGNVIENYGTLRITGLGTENEGIYTNYADLEPLQTLIINNGNLVIENTKVVNRGRASGYWYTIRQIANPSAELTVNSGCIRATLEASQGNTVSPANGARAIEIALGTFNINDGVVETVNTVKGGLAVSAYVSNDEQNANVVKINISGGTVKSDTENAILISASGSYKNSCLFNMTGGLVEAPNALNIKNTFDGIANITGGIIRGTAGVGINKEGSGTLIIGTLDGTVSTDSPQIIGTSNGIKAPGKFEFYDGIFMGGAAGINGTIREIVSAKPDQCIVVTGEDGTYKTAYLEAGGYYTVNGVYYDTLEEAYEVIASGTGVGTIKVELNNTDVSTLEIAEGHDITIDLNGMTITKTVSGLINNGKLIITGNGQITSSQQMHLITNNGNLVVSSACTLKTTATGNYAVIYGNGDLTVDANATISSKNYSAIYQSSSNTSIVNINDGKISGTNAIEFRGSVLNVKKGNITGTDCGIKNYGTLVVGTNDTSVDVYKPIIVGNNYGYYQATSSAKLEFYDGVFRSQGGVTIGGVTQNIVTAKTDGYAVYNGVENELNVSYLKKDISLVTTDAVSDVVYTGVAITPKPVVKYGSTKLTEGKDFNFNYENNKNAGTATVTIVGAGNYTGTKNITFNILKAEGTGSVTMEGWAYGEEAKSPVLESSTNGTNNVTIVYKVSTADDSTYTATKPSLPGTYTVKATFAATNNYNAVTATANFVITNGTLNGIVATGYTGTYDSNAYGITVTLSDSSEGATVQFGTKEGTYDLSASPKYTDVGTYTVYYQVSKVNYNTVTGSAQVVITKAEGLGSVTMEGWTYGETASNPVPSSSTNGTNNVTYKYKVQGAADSTYVDAKPTNAGSYTVQATFAATNNYNAVIATANFTITNGTLSGIVATGYTGTYDGNAYGITVTLSDSSEGATVMFGTKEGTYDLSASPKYTDADTYTVYYQVSKANYNTVTGSAVVDIAAKDASNLTVDTIPNQVYTGAPITPGVTVKDGNKVLVDKTDYDVLYSNNTNVGDAKVEITLKGNYEGTINTTFKILNATMSGITAKGYEDVYDGEAYGITVTLSGSSEGATVKFGTEEGTYDLDASPQYIDVGTYTVYYQVSKANYNTVTGSAIVKITAKDAINLVVEDIPDQVYTGLPIIPTVIVKNGEDILDLLDDYDIAFSANINAGPVTVTLTFKGNYFGVKTVSFNIVSKELVGVDIADIPDQPYTGSPVEPKPVVKLGDTVLKEGVDFTFGYSNHTAIGMATLTVNGINNYKGTETATFNIVDIELDGYSVEGYNGVYDRKAYGISVTLVGASVGATVRYGTSVENCTLSESPKYVNVGSYTVYYEISKPGFDTITGSEKVVISPKDVSSLTVNTIPEQIYSGSAITPIVTVKDGNTVLSMDNDYFVQYTNNTTPGTATVTITFSANYEGTLEKNFIIKNKVATATILKLKNLYDDGSGIDRIEIYVRTGFVDSRDEGVAKCSEIINNVRNDESKIIYLEDGLYTIFVDIYDNVGNVKTVVRQFEK